VGTEAAAFAGVFIKSSIVAVVNVAIPTFCKACFRVIIFLSDLVSFGMLLFSFFIFVNFNYSMFTNLLTNNKFYRFMLNLILNINKVDSGSVTSNAHLIEVL
jgi:hypothetical protein